MIFNELFVNKSFTWMPNWVATILRVYGPEEERDRFIEAVSIRAASDGGYNPLHVMVDHPDDPHFDMINWCFFYYWKNQLGTFLSFATPNETLSLLYGYKLHKAYPSLKFIYLYDQNDPISEEMEKFLEATHLLRTVMPHILTCSNAEEFSNQVKKRLYKMLQSKGRVQRAMHQHLEENKIYGYDHQFDDVMIDLFRNDQLFYLKKEERINYNSPSNRDGITLCEKIHKFHSENSDVSYIGSDFNYY